MVRPEDRRAAGPGVARLPAMLKLALFFFVVSLVAERVARLAKILGPENVLASTDCGFAQGPFHRRVHPTVMWAKLESLAEGARIAAASA